MNITEMRELLQAMAEVHPNFKPTPAMADMWLSTFKVLPSADVIEASRNAMRADRFAPTPVDVLDQLSKMYGTQPPSKAEAVLMMRNGVAKAGAHPAVVVTAEAAGTAADWRDRFDATLKNFSILYHDEMPRALDESMEIETLMVAAARREAIRNDPSLPTPGGVARPLGIPEPVALPAPPSAPCEPVEAVTGGPTEVERANQGVLLGLMRDHLRDQRTPTEWRDEIKKRVEDPKMARAELEAKGRAIEVEVRKNLAVLDLPADEFRQPKSSAYIRYTVNGSWHERHERGGPLVCRASKQKSFMNYDTAIEYAMVSAKQTDATQIFSEFTVSSQKLREAKVGVHGDDDRDLLPDGPLVLIATVNTSGLTYHVAGGKTRPLPAVYAQAGADF